MRFQQPIELIGNNNNIAISTQEIHSNGSISGNRITGNTVKTFSTNGNQQTLSEIIGQQLPFQSSHDAIQTKSNEIKETINCNGNDGDQFDNDIDECSDSESDINHMITRGNLFKLKFESEAKRSGSIECLASSADESFMDDEGVASILFLI